MSGGPPEEALRQAVAGLERVEEALRAETADPAALAALADEAVRLAGEVAGLVAESLRVREEDG